MSQAHINAFIQAIPKNLIRSEEIARNVNKLKKVIEK